MNYPVRTPWTMHQQVLCINIHMTLVCYLLVQVPLREKGDIWRCTFATDDQCAKQHRFDDNLTYLQAFATQPCPWHGTKVGCICYIFIPPAVATVRIQICVRDYSTAMNVECPGYDSQNLRPLLTKELLNTRHFCCPHDMRQSQGICCPSCQVLVIEPNALM